ncbi:hypothetical protein ACEZCY_13930 [Streptacidiphilus sp. N1-12]|uniref:Uncharacterized protein n=2 Tax=Streptacidiphilus alkalitolerans TaxID=3342712 RepID=A0ABV6V9G4_9ACTN
MSQSTEQRVPASPVDAEVDAFLAPVAGHLSAMTACRAIARFLIEQPQFATDRHINWIPQYNGYVTVEVAPRREDGPAVMATIARQIGTELIPTPFASEAHGPCISLTMYGTHHSAEWFVVTAVTAAAWAEHVVAQSTAVAA